MSVIPDGAEEFTSDGMRALRFTDDEGDHCAVRVVSDGLAQVDWMCDGEWCDLSTRNRGSPASTAMPWLRAVWAGMREKPTAEESLTAEASDVDIVMSALERASDESEWCEESNLYEPTAAAEEAAEAVDVLTSERDAATARAEKAEARVKPGWSQYRDNSDEHVATCNGCDAELPGDGSEHTWSDCLQFTRDASKIDIDMQAARIAELEAQLAETKLLYDGLRGALRATMDAVGVRSELSDILESIITEASERFPELPDDGLPGFCVAPNDSDALDSLRNCIDQHGTWPSDEAEDAGNYEACIRHMAKLLREKACLFSESAREDIRHPGISIPARQFMGHHCRITVEALYPIGGKV